MPCEFHIIVWETNVSINFKVVNFMSFLSFTAGPDLPLGLPQTDLPQQKV